MSVSLLLVSLFLFFFFLSAAAVFFLLVSLLVSLYYSLSASLFFSVSACFCLAVSLYVSFFLSAGLFLFCTYLTCLSSLCFSLLISILPSVYLCLFMRVSWVVGFVWERFSLDLTSCFFLSFSFFLPTSLIPSLPSPCFLFVSTSFLSVLCLFTRSIRLYAVTFLPLPVCLSRCGVFAILMFSPLGSGPESYAGLSVRSANGKMSCIKALS